MKKHLRVLRTLFVKDIVDMFKNPNVLLMLALPLIFIVKIGRASCRERV